MEKSSIPRSLAPVPPKGSAGDLRLGSRVVTSDSGQVQAVVLGCPDDLGARQNPDSQPGASEGPPIIRHWLYRHRLGASSELMKLTLRDFGDILPGMDLSETHLWVEKAVSQNAGDSAMVILGGSSDFSFASVSGLLQVREGSLAHLSLDSRLDLAQEKGAAISNESARRRIWERWKDRLHAMTVLGTQLQSLAPTQVRWAEKEGIRHLSLDELREGPGVAAQLASELERASESAENVVISIDLGAFAAAFAPGVSQPSADGFSAAEVLHFLEKAGANPKVCMLEVMELAPEHDHDDRSARLAALLIWRFLLGMAKRVKQTGLPVLS